MKCPSCGLNLVLTGVQTDPPMASLACRCGHNGNRLVHNDFGQWLATLFANSRRIYDGIGITVPPPNNSALQVALGELLADVSEIVLEKKR